MTGEPSRWYTNQSGCRPHFIHIASEISSRNVAVELVRQECQNFKRSVALGWQAADLCAETTAVVWGGVPGLVVDLFVSLYRGLAQCSLMLDRKIRRRRDARP